MNLPERPIAEAFANLANEVIDELIFLENVQELNPDVRTLSNINPNGSAYHIKKREKKVISKDK